MASPPFPTPNEWKATLTALGSAPGKIRCDSPMTPASGPVCVTGGTGFLALNLVRELLTKGYTVVATVRSEKDQVKMAPLNAMREEFGEDKLKIAHGVDLMKAESFDAAVSGCVGVFHTASPFTYSAEDPMDLVRPALAGTEACLSACKKAGSIKRVVLTSSMASIRSPTHPPDHAFTAEDWNTGALPDADGKFPGPGSLLAYMYSKTVAEKAGWDIANTDDCPFDLACINPPYIVGKNENKPEKEKDLNESSSIFLSILRGERAPLPNAMPWVDVADVVRAHIAAYENVEAGGKRFLCCEEVLLWTDLAVLLKKLRPACPVKTDPPLEGAGILHSVDASGLKSLPGFSFTPLRKVFQTQCESLEALGFLPAVAATDAA